MANDTPVDKSAKIVDGQTEEISLTSTSISGQGDDQKPLEEDVTGTVHRTTSKASEVEHQQGMKMAATLVANDTPLDMSATIVEEQTQEVPLTSSAVCGQSGDGKSLEEDVNGTGHESAPKANEAEHNVGVEVAASLSDKERHISSGILTTGHKNGHGQVEMGDVTGGGGESIESGIVRESEIAELSVQTAEPAEQANENGSETTKKQLSKSALKQLAKRERYKEIKMERKAMEKEKRHQETARKRKEWGEKLSSLTEEEREKARLEKLNLRKERKDEQKSKRTRLLHALDVGQNFVIDLEFSDLMKPNEISSLIQQVMYSYSANGRAAVPARISLTGVKGDVQKELDKISGFTNWLVHTEGRSYEEVFKERQSDLVYLTADSENMLESLDDSKIYIIGGLVDRNRWKNVTLEKATKQGIATAKLPIGDHLKMMASQVLTVNQVMELLLCFMEIKDWKKALMKVVPIRKRAAEEEK